MTNETRDDRVDELRQQLRALGYLDAGVDRFVLAPARGERGPLGVAARASLRVSVLAAVLLGPAAAIGLAGRLPGLVSGVRDALVLAVYLSVLFLIGAGILAFIVTGAGALLVRPGATFARGARAASSTAGWLATIGCLAYLTFWWRNANAGFGWSAPVWTTFALVIAVLISLLVGHTVRIATLGVAAARDEGRHPLPAVAPRSWSMTVVAALVAFAGCASVLVLTASPQTPTPPPPLTIVPTGYRVRVIAIDGFDPATARRSVPNAALAQALGSAYVRLAPGDTSDPARVWTTIATGVGPDVHGVHSIETRRVAGLRGTLSGGQVGRILGAATDLVQLTSPSVASREERKAKTMWEVAEDAGLRTAVVNWWASWPAPPGGGIVVTDRALLRLETGGPLDAEIGPASLYDPLRSAWPGIRQRARDTAAASFGTISDPDVAKVLRRSAELDATVVGLADELPGPPRDLDVVYLPGLDIAQHMLLAPPESGAASASAMSARIAGLVGYYAFLGQLIQPMAQPAPKQIVMVVTQPGRVSSPAIGLLRANGTGFSGQDVGPDAPARNSILDVAPTVLTALGVPLSRELEGQPADAALLGPEFAQAYKPRFVDTYGKPFVGALARTGKPLDQEMIDRLRSLGYVR